MQLMKGLFAPDHLPPKMEDAIKFLQCVYIAPISIRSQSEKNTHSLCSSIPVLWYY